MTMRLTGGLTRIARNRLWWVVVVLVMTSLMEVASLSGPNVCMVQQKYNITKRVKYRAPMAVRTYVWCFNMPPRCSRWSTEMRDLTRLETEERTAEMAVCCPGYKIKDISCVPICPHGKTGHGCSEDCSLNKWGPSCVHDCKSCPQGSCSPVTGACQCHPGWQGESCQTSSSTTTQPAVKQLITPSSAFTKNTLASPTEATSSNTNGATTVTRITSSVPNTTELATTTLTKMINFTTKIPTTVTSPTVLTTDVQMVYRNETTTFLTTQSLNPTQSLNTPFKTESEAAKKDVLISAIYNETSSPLEQTAAAQTTINTIISTSTEKNSKTPSSRTNKMSTTTTIKTKNGTSITVSVENMPQTTYKEAVTKVMTTKTTVKPTTAKFKPKEIWIKPAQKGESVIVDTKLKSNHESPKHKVDTKKVAVLENTTPKTIIVSIIPTSVTYVTYKKLALTTSSSSSQNNNVIFKSFNKHAQQLTIPIKIQTTTTKPFMIKLLNATARKPNVSSIEQIFLQNVTQHRSFSASAPKQNLGTFLSSNRMTNSMSSTLNVNSRRLDSSNPLTTPLNLSNRSTQSITSIEKSTHKSTTMNLSLTTAHSSLNEKFIALKPKNITERPVTDTLKVKNTTINQVYTNFLKNLTSNDTKTDPFTKNPTKDEETFHILTEPEHITAVMGEKGNERSSINLISVISIAGGVMIAVITVAVVIVMLERCRKPTYEEVRKYNDISLQVMIDSNDIPPPPYVRSIFHTPLPEPPIEKCHYQPISTLDRNLKQFMRPVVVQTISPLMLENFRGILECHYDHLPRRSQNFGTTNSRCSLAPPSEEGMDLLHPRTDWLTDSAIEAMKCEAKQDVIDNTTSEPLYAEIPCWRPPSEHAVEVVNLHGEAVTEL